MSVSVDRRLLDWLLEPANPSVRYGTLRLLLDRPPDDAEVQAAQQAIMAEGPVPQILALQDSAGWWLEPGSSIGPLYRSTIWQLLYLAELHANPTHPQVRLGCEYVFHTMQRPEGDFYNEPRWPKQLPSDLSCYEGITAWMMLRLSAPDDPRLEAAIRYLTEQIAAKTFVCRYNGTTPCGWGASKTLRALAAIPERWRTPETQQALQAAADFILDNNLAEAAYPTKAGGKVSAQWFTFAFPRGYQSDILETLVGLAEAGFADDPRARPALDVVLSKRKPEGHWCLEQTLKQMPVPLEKASKRMPSKWITLRALYVLKQAGMVERIQ